MSTTVQQRWAAVGLALVLAFGFLGTRSIWEPDEGRYTNVALTMLDSGDWLNPMRNEHTGHWTKPPMTYWLIASSVGAFGSNPWAARLPVALAYLACGLLTWASARRLSPGCERVAGVAFMTMVLPFAMGQIVTTDFPLAAWQALAMWAFVEYRFGQPRHGARWICLMAAALALAFLTKGPPALVPLLAVVALAVLAPGRSRLPFCCRVGALAVFLLLALPWFVYVTLRHQGLLQYFLGQELVERVASNDFDRNGEWYGWARIYVPTLLVGSLPWTLDLLRWFRALPARMRRWLDPAVRRQQAAALLVASWIVLPLIVFCLAKSRLPTYLLPLFVPLAIAIAAQRRARGRSLPRWPLLAVWVVLLLGLRLAVAHYPTHKDAAQWAEALRERSPAPVTEVVFVDDMARYGLHVYLGAGVEKVSLRRTERPRFNPGVDESLAAELAEARADPGLVFVTTETHWPAVRQYISDRAYGAEPLGKPYRGRVIFRVLAGDGEPPPAGGAVQE